MRPRMVLVEWLDSHGGLSDGWSDRQEVIDHAIERTTEPLTSCGFLIAENKSCVVLALDFDHHNDNVNNTMAIPRSAIIAIHPLRKGK